VCERTERGSHGAHYGHIDKEIIMKRPSRLMSMIAAAALSAAVAPAALAGNDIVKCVDASGHITLTDQPCESGASTVKLSGETPLPPQRQVRASAELRQAAWKPAQVVRPAPLSRDIATLKEARRTLMLSETRPRLAGLN
jgi:hypothetical protein